MVDLLPILKTNLNILKQIPLHKQGHKKVGNNMSLFRTLTYA